MLTMKKISQSMAHAFIISPYSLYDKGSYHKVTQETSNSCGIVH